MSKDPDLEILWDEPEPEPDLVALEARVMLLSAHVENLITRVADLEGIEE